MAAALFPDSANPLAGQLDLRSRIAGQKASGLKGSSSDEYNSHSSSVRPPIVDQTLHLIDQTLHPRLMSPSILSLPISDSSAHLPLLEVQTRQPSPTPIFPESNKSIPERGLKVCGMNSRVGVGIIADADIRIQPKTF